MCLDLNLASNDIVVFEVASRTVLPGELVLAESPIVVGPNQVSIFSFFESLIAVGVYKL